MDIQSKKSINFGRFADMRSQQFGHIQAPNKKTESGVQKGKCSLLVYMPHPSQSEVFVKVS